LQFGRNHIEAIRISVLDCKPASRSRDACISKKITAFSESGSATVDQSPLDLNRTVAEYGSKQEAISGELHQAGNKVFNLRHFLSIQSNQAVRYSKNQGSMPYRTSDVNIFVNLTTDFGKKI
jgi:hypothetical protein